jgi:hypothetical protein
VYFAVYEGMLLFLSLVLLRCDQQLKIWRKEEDEILLFGSLVWLSLVLGSIDLDLKHCVPFDQFLVSGL